MSRYGLIAGNGRFPQLALEVALREGYEMVVVAIENEAAPELAHLTSALHWVNIGQLGKLIDIFKEANITEVMMTGQVKHVSIFSSVKPVLRPSQPSKWPTRWFVLWSMIAPPSNGACSPDAPSA